MMHHHFFGTLSDASSHEWRHSTPTPFNELIVSWNSERPAQGHFAIELSVHSNDAWSPWLRTAEWGASSQRGFVASAEFVSVNQDTIALTQGRYGSAFAVRVLAKEGASLHALRALHVCASSLPHVASWTPIDTLGSGVLPVCGLSQMALADPRKARVCSPTSLTAVLRFLCSALAVDPIQFAESAWDADSDIFGNWSLNVAAAAALLGAKWACWAERLSGFGAALQHLQAGTPVVISVRGPLVVSAELYQSGHLLVVKGFDAPRREVLCMDPAFPSDAATDVRYPLEALLAAWERRGRLAYVCALV